MNYCKDCVSYMPPNYGPAYCRHPKTGTENPVDGRHPTNCSDARSPSAGLCGLVGKFFVAKPIKKGWLK